MKKKRNHYSIQIQFRNPCPYKTYLYKEVGKTDQEAIKECIELARGFYSKYEGYEPYKVDIVNELTTKRERIL